MRRDEAIRVELTPTQVALASKYARNCALGGRSAVRTSQRANNLHTDQFIGQVCTLAYHLHRYGNTERYERQRDQQDLTPWKGDGGSDDAGHAVDVKGSLMRVGLDPMRYNLLVRPRERHAGNRYVLALVEPAEPSSKPLVVWLVGWLADSALPEPETDGVLAGACAVPAASLNRLEPGHCTAQRKGQLALFE